jgi:hypothetical protein
VPADHLLRGIDTFLDLSALRQQLAPFYSHTGRPSIDPELMIRMLIVGYCFGIRSERRLCEEVHLNLAYRWFCRLGLDDMLAWLVEEKKIEPHIPVWDKAERQDGTFNAATSASMHSTTPTHAQAVCISKLRAAQRPKGRSSTDRRTSSVRAAP